MNIKKIVLSTVLIAIALYLSATKLEDDIFNQAIDNFELKNYQEALDGFLTLQNEGYVSADLYYDIGNCYYRLDQLGMTILYYKKALKVNSGYKAANRDLRYMLSLTKDKQQIDDPDLISGLWQKLLSSLNLNILAIILIGFTALLIFFIDITIINFRNRERTLPYFLISITFFIIAVFMVITFVKFQQYRSSSEAVLISKSAIGFSGPGEDFTRVFTIHEGMLMDIEKSEDQWSLIKLSNGLGGWIPTNSFIRIELE